LKTIIGSELRDRSVNWIGVSIAALVATWRMSERANVLAELDPTEVQTVAYVPVEASGGRRARCLGLRPVGDAPRSDLGGKGTIEMDRKMLEAAREQIKNSPGKNVAHSWSLMAAMIDPSIELLCTRINKTGEVRYLFERGAINSR